MARAFLSIAKIYASLIRDNRINPRTESPYSIEDVPSNIVSNVEDLLDIRPSSPRIVKDEGKIIWT